MKTILFLLLPYLVQAMADYMLLDYLEYNSHVYHLLSNKDHIIYSFCLIWEV